MSFKSGFTDDVDDDEFEDYDDEEEEDEEFHIPADGGLSGIKSDVQKAYQRM